MNVSSSASRVEAARSAAFRPIQPGDVVNVLVDAIESLGFKIRPGSVDEDGLAGEMPDGQVIRVGLDFHRRDKVGATL